MNSDIYDLEQKEALTEIRGIVSQLAEIEDLQRRMCSPRYGLKDALDSMAADLALDSFPPYYVLEERLRDSLRRTESLGLGDDPYILEILSISKTKSRAK